MSARAYVGVGLSTYHQHAALPHAVTTTEELAALLRDEHGFADSPPILADPGRGELLDGLDSALAPNAYAGGVLIVGWTGHGVLGAGQTLRLLVRGPDRDVDDIVDAARLAERALGTKAHQVLLLLDVCFAGGGIAEALKTALAIATHEKEVPGRWFGVLAACRGDEPALAGALPQQLERLLREGPRQERSRLQWLVSGHRVAANRVLQDLLDEWDVAHQSPKIASTGAARDMFRNVLFPARTGVVEHLLTAARSTTTEANFFVGRAAAQRRITTWARTAASGSLVITGPPGCGKSSLLGRVVSLSDPEEGTRIREAEAVPADLDIGRGSIHAHLHLRRLNGDQIVEQLCQQLACPYEATPFGLLAFAEQRARAGDPLLLALDGLDEMAGTDLRTFVDEILGPLTAHARVLVASREIPAFGGVEGLLPAARPPEILDLGASPEDTLADVREYVLRRLDGVDRAMGADVVANAVVEEARGFIEDGPFLFARLITSQLRDEPVDTSQPGWRASLATGVAAALDRDLSRAVLDVDGRPHPTAARELLTALGWAEGAGFPADDDLWPRVATTLSPSGTQFERTHVLAVLDQLRRHLVIDAHADATVFRIAHQRLAEHLRKPGFERDRLRVASTVGEHYRDLLAGGMPARAHAYLWLHAWRHLAEAGEPGIELLRSLIQYDPALELDLALALQWVAETAAQQGDAGGAVHALAEAVDIRRRLEPDGSAQLALLLIELGSARREAGDVDGANRDADEGTAMARRHATTPAGRGVLIAALVGRAVHRMRTGEFHAAARQVEEALALLSESGLDEATATAVEVELRTLLARLSFLLLDFDASREEAGRLRGLADRLAPVAAGEPEREAALLFARIAVFQVEVFPKLTAVAALGSPAVEPASDRDLVDALLALAPADPKRGLARLEALSQVLTARHYGLVHPDDVALNPTDVLLGVVQETVDAVDPRSTDAAIALGGVLTIRAMISKETRAADLDQAEALLRRALRSDASAALRLAAMLEVKARAAGPSPAALEALGEASELLAGVGTGLADQMRLGMLLFIGQCAVQLGDLTSALAAADTAIDIARVRPEIRSHRPDLWAGVLTEASALIGQGRTLEAQQAGEEALLAIQALEPGPIAANLRVAVLNNIALALMLQDRLDEAAARLEAALEAARGEGGVQPAILGLVHSNLAMVGLRTGRPDAGTTLRHAETALELAKGPGGQPHHAIMAQVGLAAALHAIGRIDAGAGVLDAAVDGMLRLLAEGRAAVPLVADAANRNWTAPDPWDRLLERPDLEPEARDELRLVRVYPVERTEEAVAEFIARLEAAGTGGGVTNLRGLARLQRARAPERFDAAWLAATGRVDDWLTIPRTLEDLVVAWWNTPTWADSEAFLRQHTQLLDPLTDLLIDEIGAAKASWIVEGHREALAAARQGDPAAGFVRLRAREIANHWARSAEPVEYILGRVDDVPAQDLDEMLAELEMLAHHAILVLVRRGEHGLAAEAVHRAPDWRPLLATAMASADSARTRSLAILCLTNERSTDVERSDAFAAWLLAAVLEDSEDELSAVLEVCLGDERSAGRVATRTALLEVISRHPDHASGIATLVRRLEVSDESA